MHKIFVAVSQKCLFLFSIDELSVTAFCNSVTLICSLTTRAHVSTVSVRKATYRDLSLYSFVLSPERTTASFSSCVSQSGRRAEWSDGGAPGCAHATRANRRRCCRRREIPPPHHPPVHGGNLCETRTPRPVRHRGKHEVFGDDTRRELTYQTRSFVTTRLFERISRWLLPFSWQTHVPRV